MSLPKILTTITIAFLVLIGILAITPGPDRPGAEIVITPNDFLNQAGATWTAKVFVRANQPVNSVDTTIHYDTQLVTFQQVTIEDSAFDMTVFEPQINKDQGTIRFVQTTLAAPTDQQALVGEITFKGTKQGQLNLTHSDTTIVAHDGQGTNIHQPQLNQSILQWLYGQLPWVK